MKDIITSSKNPGLKEIALLLKSKKERDESGRFIIEGLRIFKDAVKSAPELIDKVYCCESFYMRYGVSGEGKGCDEILRSFDFNGSNVEIVKDSVFDAVSGTVTPQGIMCVMKQEAHDLTEIVADAAKGSGRLLLLEDIQDPGNLGTMLRTAEAAGIGGIIMSRGTVDIYNPKVIRSTMGSVFRMPFIYADDFTGVMEELKRAGYTLYGAYLHGGVAYSEISYPRKTAILIGNEGNGISDEVISHADRRIFIPMAGEIESLNAAVAATVLMFYLTLN